MLRAGLGVFYGGQGSLGADGRGINNFPYNRSVTANSAGSNPALQLSSGYPDNFLGSPNAPPPQNLNWIVWQQDFPSPQVAQWNVAVQRELSRSLSLTVAYVGSGTSYIMDAYNWNGADPGPPATEKNRRRIPAWNNINLRSPIGHSTYHGMDAQLERRFSSGLSFSASYTWSHALDNVAEQFGSGGGSFQSTKDLSSAKGNTNFDMRHRFVSGAVYELPVGRGRRWMKRGGLLDVVLGGWQLSGMTAVQTGHYFDITVPNARTVLGASAIGDWWPNRIDNPRLETRSAARLVRHCRLCHAPRRGRHLPVWQRRPGNSRRRRFVQPGSGADEELPPDRAVPDAVPLGVVQRQQHAHAVGPQRFARQPGFRQVARHGEHSAPDAVCAAPELLTGNRGGRGIRVPSEDRGLSHRSLPWGGFAACIQAPATGAVGEGEGGEGETRPVAPRPSEAGLLSRRRQRGLKACTAICLEHFD